jgi:hypothetical protein
MDDLMDETFLEDRIAHRAIGVVYNPEPERYGNYVPSISPRVTMHLFTLIKLQLFIRFILQLK